MSSLLPLPPSISTPRLLLITATRADIPTIHTFRSSPTIMKYMGNKPHTSIAQTEAWWNLRYGPESSGLGCVYLIILRDQERYWNGVDPIARDGKKEGEGKMEGNSGNEEDGKENGKEDGEKESGGKEGGKGKWGGIHDSSNRLIIGTIGSKELPSLGYGIHEDYWGRGIGSEAVRALVETYFECFPPFYPANGLEEGVRDMESMEGAEGMEEEMKKRVWTMGQKRNYVSAGVIEGNVGSCRVLEKCGFELQGREWVEIDKERGFWWVLKFRRWREGFRPEGEEDGGEKVPEGRVGE